MSFQYDPSHRSPDESTSTTSKRGQSVFTPRWLGSLIDFWLESRSTRQADPSDDNWEVELELEERVRRGILRLQARTENGCYSCVRHKGETFLALPMGKDIEDPESREIISVVRIASPELASVA